MIELNELRDKAYRNAVVHGWHEENLSDEHFLCLVISDCVQNHPSVWAEKGVWNWVLKDAVLFDKPIINVKGKLSFWEYE